MKLNITSEASGHSYITVHDVHDILLFDGALHRTQDGHELSYRKGGYPEVIKTFRGDDELRRMATVLTFISARLKATP